MEALIQIKKILPKKEMPYRQADELTKILPLNYETFLATIQTTLQEQIAKGYDTSSHMIEVENTYLLSQYLCYILVERMELEDEKLRKQLKEFFYVKDFVGWAEDKVKIDMGMYEPKSVNPKQPKQKCIRKRTIWNTKRGINIGSESDGKGKYLRPALILRVMGKLCLAVPLTTKAKIKNTPTARYYHQLQSVSFPNIQSFIMLNQIKIIDQKRCIKEMGEISANEFKEIKNLLRNLYFPEG